MNYSPDGLLIAPHNVEAEQFVLGSLLIDNNSIDRMGELVEEDFFSNRNKLVYKAIRKQSATGKAWDVITVAEELENFGRLEEAGGLGYIGSMAHNTPSSANILQYANIIREHSIRRAILVASAELSEMVTKRIPVHEIMDKAQSRLMAITEGQREDEPQTIGAIIGAHLDTLQHRLSAERNGITTGVHDLDDMLNGGWHRGQVIVIAARPSMGKTALSLHAGLEASISGYGVLYLSMEMVKSELADRAIAAHGRINLGNILTARMTEDEWSGVSSAASKLHELPFFVVDRPGLTFYQAASYARRHKRKNGLDILVLDYLQLMAGNADDKRHAQIEEITRNLKVLAKELNIAVILLSQLARKTENARRPKLSDLRDSGSIEQDADIVLFIHREEMDNPETTWKNYADIWIAKNRQGALGRVGVTYIGEQVRFAKYHDSLPNYDSDKGGRGFK